MKNLFLVMAASLFGLSASAQVLITDANTFRAVRNASKPALRGIPPT